MRCDRNGTDLNFTLVRVGLDSRACILSEWVRGPPVPTCVSIFFICVFDFFLGLCVCVCVLRLCFCVSGDHCVSSVSLCLPLNIIYLSAVVSATCV